MEKLKFYNCKNIFDFDLLKKMLLFAKMITESTTEEEIYKIFYYWLRDNKDYKEKVSLLNQQQIKDYNNLIKQDLIKYQQSDNVLFIFNRIKFYLNEYILSEAYNNSGRLNNLNEKENLLKLSPYTFNEFLNISEKKEYFVKNMFAKGTINMIFSPPANMKSFISYYLGLCLATGQSFLGQQTKKVNVGYFDWENPISDIQNRINGICRGMNFEISTINNFYFFPKQPILMKTTNYDSFLIETLKNQLMEFIEKNNIKVLFFDTLRRLGNFDENDSKAINTIKSELFDPLVNRYEVCVIFLHHTSKEGKNYRGSVDIEGILDTAFLISKKINDDNINLHIKNTKRRNNEIEELNTLIEIENNEIEDDNGDMYNFIKSVKFLKIIENEINENGEYAQYRTYFIENLVFGTKYKNKELIEMLQFKFSISSSKTLNKIVKWLYNIHIIMSYGTHKNKYYILNPTYCNKNEEIKLKEINKHLISLFIENELIDINSLKSKLDEKYYSILISQWIDRGWLNPLKNGYLSSTKTFKIDNDINKIDVEVFNY